MKKKIVFRLYSFSIIVLLLWGANAWFLMNLPFDVSLSIRILIFILALWYKVTFNIKLKFNVKQQIAIISFILAGIFARQITRFESFMTFAITYYPIVILLADRNNCEEIMNVVKKVLAFILVPSMILHLIFISTSYPPSFLFEVEGNSQYTFFNYIFLIKNIVFEFDNIRFGSIFLEPGYLGTLCSFMLYALKFNFKDKACLIIGLALVLSLSLAGYISAFVAWIFWQYSKGESVKKYVIYLIMFGGVYVFSQNYNGGKNFAMEYIFSRLESDKDKGIKGNNRNSELTDFYFEKMCEDGSILWGLGQDQIQKINGGGANDGDFTNQIRGAGYKIYCVNNGCLAAVLFILFYFLVADVGSVCQRRYNKMFALLILIIFMQASYPTSFSWIIPFILGINTSKEIKHI